MEKFSIFSNALLISRRAPASGNGHFRTAASGLEVYAHKRNVWRG